MDISIIIPNYQSKIIGETLSSLLTQKTHHVYEIIVVGVDSYGIVEKFNDVNFINTKVKCPPAKARNIGASISNGEILIFLDADCIVPDGWLEIMVEPFSDSNIIVVGGGVSFQEKNYWTIADNISMFHSFLKTKKKRFVTQLPSINLAIRKKNFIEIGGFDETYLYPSGEDFAITLLLSLKGRLLFCPEAWITHIPERYSLGSLISHSYLQGKFSTKVDKRYKNFIHFPFRNKILLILLAPFLAFISVIKIYVETNIFIHYFYTFPAVYISKIVWCFGASQSPYLT